MVPSDAHKLRLDSRMLIFSRRLVPPKLPIDHSEVAEFVVTASSSLVQTWRPPHLRGESAPLLPAADVLGSGSASDGKVLEQCS